MALPAHKFGSKILYVVRDKQVAYACNTASDVQLCTKTEETDIKTAHQTIKIW